MFGHYPPGQGFFGKAGAEGAFYTKALSGAVTSAGVLSSLFIYFKALSGAVVTIVGTLTYRNSIKALVGTLNTSGVLFRSTSRTLSSFVTPTGSVFRSFKLFLSGLVTAVGDLLIPAPDIFTVWIGGVLFDRIRDLSLEIEDVLNEVPNRCTFTCNGTPPIEGQSISVVRPDGSYEFAGNILTVRQGSEERRSNLVSYVTCEDPTWKFNRRLVTKRWTNTSATTIAQEITAYAAGFTTANIVAGLPTVAEFDCVLEEPAKALGRLAAEIAGNNYVDYLSDVHFFLTETTEAPADFDEVYKGSDLVHSGDLAQVRTRVTGVGGGSSALENSATGTTTIPLEDASMFEDVGGSFISDSNIGAYTSKHNGGVASTISGNVPAPSSAPTAAIALNVVGVLQGNKTYKVAFANAQGETPPGSASNTVTGVAFVSPVAASVGATASVIGKLVGVYLYVLTYITDLGETTGGTSFGRTAIAVAAPGAATIGAGSTIGKLIGAYNYRLTFKSLYGQTEGGTVFSRTAVAVATPGTPTLAAVSSTIGKLIGAYGYKVTTVSAFGESAASAAGLRTAVAQSAPTAPSSFSSATDGNAVLVAGPLKGTYNWKVAFVASDGRETLGSSASSTFAGITPTTPSISSTGAFTIRAKIAFFHPTFGESGWSADVQDTSSAVPVTITLAMLGGVDDIPSGCRWRVASTDNTNTGSGGPFFDVGNAAAGASTLVYSSLGTVLTAAGDTLGRVASFTIPTGPTGTISRRIYRTKVGGSDYYLAGEVGDNSTTTFKDSTPDVSLTLLAPTQNLNGEQHTVSSISTGATGTTARRIYRTEAGGSVYYYLDTVPDNATTSYTDNRADSELNHSITAPSVATSGDQHSLTGIPTGPTGTLTRVLWRTKVGGTTYYRLDELGDNTATAYTDNKSDNELGAEVAPTVSTAGGQSHDLSFIPTGPTGTLGRNIYRTVAGGSSYQFVGTLTDNVATTFVDNKADGELGNYVPLVNTAGANQVALSNILTGPAGVTQRVVYRLDTDGAYKFVDTLNDNTTTTYTDNTPDTSLGRVALTVGTIGAINGDITLILGSTIGFPSLGWVNVDSQVIRYTSISGDTLVGIPGFRTTTITRSGTTATATTTGSHGFVTGQIVTIQGAIEQAYNGSFKIIVTGTTTFTYVVAGAPTTPATGTIQVAAVGAILSPISGGLTVVTLPSLNGVTGVLWAIDRGSEILLYTQRNDTAAQTALAALEGGDGIHESPINDSSIITLAGLNAACDAELVGYKTKIRSITFTSRDKKLRSGKTIRLALSSPFATFAISTFDSGTFASSASGELYGDFLIQRVISSQFNISRGLFPFKPVVYPLRSVTAAPVLVSFKDVLRRKELI